MKIKALVVDDEADARSVLRKMIELFCPEIQATAEAEDIRTAIRLLKRDTYHLIFLDIRLGRENALDSAAALQRYCPNIIFVTAFQDYAVEAYRTEAIHYLLKPVDPELLQEAVDRGVARAKQAVMENHIVLATRDHILRLALEDIAYLQGDGNYCYFHTMDGEAIFVSRNLRHYEQQLSEELFFRIHQSYLIRLAAVELAQSDGSAVTLQGGTTLPVARRKRADFLRCYRPAT